MDFGKLQNSALQELDRVSDAAGLEAWRVKYLGRKSEIALFLRSMAERSAEERRTLGKGANELRKALEEAHENKKNLLGQDFGLRGTFDITQPGKKFTRGHLHLLTLVMRQMVKIFGAMGFEVVEGPEIETEHYNFDALNIPEWHPARDLWDTFWIKMPEKAKQEQLLLRTHTSPVQIRYMETHPSPFRIIVPGRAFRHEATDARHESQFQQLEGLMVGPDVSFANFKWVMEHFIKQFFGPETKLQLRASYFPFTEPSFEVLMTCVICGGKGVVRGSRCRVCGGEKWLEMGGAGMVHPQVFRNVGYDPKKVQGFAFGIGPDRFAMIKYKIDDIRLFYAGDLRFIKQF